MILLLLLKLKKNQQIKIPESLVVWKEKYTEKLNYYF